MEDGLVTIRASEPIFPVADVVGTVRYYREVLGFREGWTWGDPPDFGGVRWGKVGAMFSLRSEPAASLGGQWHSFFSGMVLGDGATFAYLKDIAVLPEWQGRGIGTRIVAALLAILRRAEPDGMLVTLFTGQHLADFYERAGFLGPEKLYGMSLNLERPTQPKADRAASEAP